MGVRAVGKARRSSSGDSGSKGDKKSWLSGIGNYRDFVMGIYRRDEHA